MDDSCAGQTTDTVLGQEFLTWLWFRSENHPLGFQDKNGSFTVAMEQRIVVQGGEAAVAFDAALYRPRPLEDLLGGLGVIPKARLGGALVQLLALHLQPVNIQGLAQLPEGGLHSGQAQSQFVQFQHRHNKISLLHHKIGPGACQSLFIVSYFLANVKALARVFVLIPSPAPAQGPLQDRESQR